jgi:carboxypeptidase D
LAQVGSHRSLAAARSARFAARYRDEDAFDKAIALCAEQAGRRARPFVAGHSVAGKPIRAVTVSGSPHAERARPQALVTGNIHGNEIIAGEVALGVLALLCEPSPSPHAAALLSVADVTVVPVVNPDMRERTLHGLRSDAAVTVAPRRNRRGVDLNRNFPTPGNAETSLNPLAGTRIPWLPWYKGPKALSEPESAAIALLAQRLQPYAGVHFHSTGNLVLYPPGSTPDPPHDVDAFLRMCNAFVDAQRDVKYAVKQSAAWYPLHGGLNDYLYDRYGTLSITVEISAPFETLRLWPSLARWSAWWNNPPDPAPHVFNDAAACLHALCAALDAPTRQRYIPDCAP